MLPPNWQQDAKEHQKAYKRLLEKGNKNKMLHALPALHEEAFNKIFKNTIDHEQENADPI